MSVFRVIECHSFEVLYFELIFSIFLVSFFFKLNNKGQKKYEKVISNFHLELSAIFRGGFLHALHCMP